MLDEDEALDASGFVGERELKASLLVVGFAAGDRAVDDEGEFVGVVRCVAGFFVDA
ncbi:MAG: hypothetical protein ACOYMN_12860 [Roseimicrobium sp.]